MSNQTDNRKKSNFAAQTSLPSDAYLDYVSGGVNYRIDLTSFQTSLGVTGTIVQAGDSTGLPILQTTGSVNNIRNLENGAGIISSVSPLNGAKIAQNVANGSGGQNTIVDTTTSQIVHRNIKAGSGAGVSIDPDDDALIISATGVEVATKTVPVSSLSDLPTPVSGVITLADDTDYLFLNDITTADRFVVGNPTSIRAASPSMVSITYTGGGDMFTGTTPSIKFNSIRLIPSASGTLFNLSSTGSDGLVQLIECNVGACGNLGTLNGNFITRFHNVAFEDVSTTGLLMTGAHSNFVMETVIAFLNAGTLVDFGTATFNVIDIKGVIIEASAVGTTIFSGAASSANLNAGKLGVISDTRIGGSATPLSGITTEDFRWVFVLNDGIEDTRTDALLSMQGNATDTVIAGAGTGVLVAGTWVIEETSQMTGTAAGRATLDTERGAKLPITGSVSLAPVSGGNITVAVEVAINGSVVSGSKRTGTASSGNPTSLTVPWQYDFQPTDYVELWVTNEDTTVDLLVTSAILRVD